MISEAEAMRSGRPASGAGEVPMPRSLVVKPTRPALGLEPRPTAASSRISPPEPVAAPEKGAMAVG